MKSLNSRPIDTVDLLSLPAFVGTMLWESHVLARRDLREFGDLDDATPEELSDPALPADPLVPVGYERRDTTASLDDARRERRGEPGDSRAASPR